MNKNTVVLLLAGFLIIIGLGKFNLSDLRIGPNRPVVIDVLELPAPTDANILKEANDIVALVKSQMSKEEARRLRNLYLDIQQLISLDNEDEAVKTTEDIRQANSLAGSMLRLDMKGKYSSLAKELKEVIVTAIGDDNIPLSPDLRIKSMDGFGALAWALNEGSK